MEAAVVAAWRGRPSRRATATIVLALVAVAVALVLLTRSHDEPSLTLSTRPAQVTPPRVHGHLVFGMTPQQVLRRTGDRYKVRGNCWLFAPSKRGIVGSIAVQPSWSRFPYDPKVQGGLELCFTAGRYSYSYQHVYDPRKHTWVWFAWPQTLVHGSTDYSDGV